MSGNIVIKIVDLHRSTQAGSSAMYVFFNGGSEDT